MFNSLMAWDDAHSAMKIATAENSPNHIVFSQTFHAGHCILKFAYLGIVSLRFPSGKTSKIVAGNGTAKKVSSYWCTTWDTLWGLTTAAHHRRSRSQ